MAQAIGPGEDDAVSSILTSERFQEKVQQLSRKGSKKGRNNPDELALRVSKRHGAPVAEASAHENQYVINVTSIKNVGLPIPMTKISCGICY
jgi:hypothetical protein